MNLKINHRLGKVDVKYFNEFDVTLKYDSVASTFSFKVDFDPKNREHAEALCLSHFHEAEVMHNGETLITGFILSNVLARQAVKELVQLGGYSKPGVFEDSNIPPDLYPLQADGLTLSEIANKLAQRFKIKVIVDPIVSEEMNKVITKTTAQPTQTIKDYLTELAIQRKVVMSHDEKGNLLFTKAKTKQAPLFHIEDGAIDTRISLSFSGQGIHSHITVMKQADADGGNAGEHTIQNPYCPVAYVYRPKVITQTSGDDITSQEAAKQALMAELKNIVLTVELDRWDVNNKIIRPNNIISIKSPENFIYQKTNFFIESINYKGNNEKQTATLTCVLPEVYNGETPKNIFVNPHENLPRI